MEQAHFSNQQGVYFMKIRINAEGINEANQEMIQQALESLGLAVEKVSMEREWDEFLEHLPDYDVEGFDDFMDGIAQGFCCIKQEPPLPDIIYIPFDTDNPRNWALSTYEALLFEGKNHFQAAEYAKVGANIVLRELGVELEN